LRFSENQKQLIITAKIIDTLIYRAESLLAAEGVWSATMDGALQQRMQSSGRDDCIQFHYPTYSVPKGWVEVSQRAYYPTGESSKEALRYTLVSDEPACNDDAARGGAFEY